VQQKHSSLVGRVDASTLFPASTVVVWCSTLTSREDAVLCAHGPFAFIRATMVSCAHALHALQREPPFGAVDASTGQSQSECNLVAAGIGRGCSRSSIGLMQARATRAQRAGTRRASQPTLQQTDASELLNKASVQCPYLFALVPGSRLTRRLSDARLS